MKQLKRLFGVWVVLALYSSYCYSETITGQTNNAAANGLQWSMTGLLPSETNLIVNGLIYRYTIEKDANTDGSVHIRNKDTEGDGYIMENTDNWNQLPGATITKALPLERILGSRYGDGEISVEGDGKVSDATVIYNYQYDPCLDPLTDPSCSGYADARRQWVLENGIQDDIIDPYNTKEVQDALNQEVMQEEEKLVEQEEDSEDDEKMNEMASDNESMKEFSKLQAKALAELNKIPQQFQLYYDTALYGGVYEDVVNLDGGELIDNTRALNNLAGDAKHRSMVRSQYDK
jgi:hypothetical protein